MPPRIPATGELIQTKTAADRLYFLFFNEIHKFDFYAIGGPVHDLVALVLMLVGTAISLTGVVLGWKRLTPPRGIKGSPRHGSEESNVLSLR